MVLFPRENYAAFAWIPSLSTCKKTPILFTQQMSEIKQNTGHQYFKNSIRFQKYKKNLGIIEKEINWTNPKYNKTSKEGTI